MALSEGKIMNARIVVTHYVSLALLAIAGIASGEAPIFQITQLYSNADGSVQFIELAETGGSGGWQRFAGLTLTMTHEGVVKKYTFASDIAIYPHQKVLVATAPGVPWDRFNEFFGESLCTPDFVIPYRFLATDGGTLDFAGTDQMTYTSLPTDGTQSLHRDGIGAATCLFLNQYTVPVSPTPITAVEYVNPARDHYFITASAPDIDALDAGRIAGWHRTGLTFLVEGTAVADVGMVQPVCRFYIPPFEGDSHFFSAFPEECSQVGVRHPEYVRETDAAFYVALPDPTTGACNGGGGLPVYRLWNQRSDSNHRYTTNLFIRGLMLQRGYASEGYGPDGVAFCVEAGPSGGGPNSQNMVIEYYNAERDQYFITATYADINAFDSGGRPGWQRTGWTFSAGPDYAPDLGLTDFVCRFYIPASDDHFFAVSYSECRQVAVQHPEYMRELGNELYVSLADKATGTCSPSFELIPVFSVRKPGADGGQRFTTNVFIRSLMIQQGYVADGFGPNGVAFCVPGEDVSP